VHRTCPVLQGRAASGTRQPRELTSAASLKFTGLSGVHRTVSGAPEDSNSNLPPSGIFRGHSAIIHRTCPVLQGRAASGTRQPRELTSAASLKFTGLSGVHRTVRCNSGATAISAPTALCGAFNARCARADVRRAHTGAPDKEQ
jgi:hypothetical protein